MQDVILSKYEHALVPHAYSSWNKITVALCTEGMIECSQLGQQQLPLSQIPSARFYYQFP